MRICSSGSSTRQKTKKSCPAHWFSSGSPSLGEIWSNTCSRCTDGSMATTSPDRGSFIGSWTCSTGTSASAVVKEASLTALPTQIIRGRGLAKGVHLWLTAMAECHSNSRCSSRRRCSLCIRRRRRCKRNRRCKPWKYRSTTKH